MLISAPTTAVCRVAAWNIATLRLAAGRQWQASVLLGRRRAVAVEVVEGDHRYDVSLRSPRHALPVLRVVFMGAATLGLVLARRHRTGRDT